MAAKKAPAKKKPASAADFRMKEEADKKKAKLSRVTSNIPSVYKPGNAVSLSKTPGSRGVRTEPTKIVRNGPFKTSALVTKVKSGAPATANMAKPGKSNLNRVTSNIPSQVKPKKSFGQGVTSSRKGVSGAAENVLYGATKIVGSTVLGGASAGGKLIRKVTPLPDKPKSRAMRTEPTQYMRNGWGESLPVPKSKKKK